MSIPPPFVPPPSPEPTAPLPAARVQPAPTAAPPPQPQANTAPARPGNTRTAARATTTVQAAPTGPAKAAAKNASGWRLAARERGLDAVVLPHSLATQCRLVLSAPSVDSFDLVRIDARWRSTLTLLLASGALAGAVYNLGRPGFGGFLPALVWGVLGGLLWAVLGFVAGGALLGFFVRRLGGKVNARVLAYNLAVSLCPVLAGAVMLGRVPFVGPVLSGLLLGYALLLAVLAVISSERMEVGRALGAVLLTVGALMVLALVAVVGIALWVVLGLSS